MSKAEDLALEKYPRRSVLVVPARCGGYYADSHLREGFIDGYHQAEKDLELTVEDIVHIIETYNELEFSGEFTTVTFNDTCKEVLKRFKKTKNGRPI